MKNIFKSRIIWANVIGFIVVAGSLFGITPDTTLATEVSGAIITILPLINIVLRFFTSKSITLDKTE